MHYTADIKAIKQTELGTELIIKIPNEQLEGLVLKQRILKAEIRLDDARVITNEQRRKLYATIRDIAQWQADSPEYLKEMLKFMYCMQSGEENFSLSDCSVLVAREFISYVIDFALEHGVHLNDSAINRTDDIDRYLYSCLKHRVCCITGRSNAEVHHVTGSRVGMGRNRVTINHKNLKIMALSREWHNKVHNEGELELFKEYKIYGIKADAELLDKLNLSYDDID